MSNQSLEHGLPERLAHWDELYRDLHAHPELGFAEHRTAATVARELGAATGWEVTEGVGGTGVVGVLRNGDGPTVLLRADMDALPVSEETGLAYASVEEGRMHACGHDLHTTALLGACHQFAANPGAWSGTVVAVFQPAEEIGDGAEAMLDDGLLERFPYPEVCLAQHVGPIPGGMVATRAGTLMAAADSLRVTLHGAGGHASVPHRAVDPVVLASSTVMRLQTLSALQAGQSPGTVLTVGALRAGTAANVIPDSAELLLSLRTFSDSARADALSSIERIVQAEAEASGAPKAPEIETLNTFPRTANSEDATRRVGHALEGTGAAVVSMPSPLPGSEDFGAFGTAAGCPSVFWHFGGTDPADFTPEEVAGLRDGALPASVPTNHSPRYAPAPEHSLGSGVRNMLAAAHAWLGTGR